MTPTRKTLVFGCGGLAEVMSVHLSRVGRPVVAFTLEQQHLQLEGFEALPVVAWEEITPMYPPEDHDLVIPLGWSQVNAVRERIYAQAKAMGYGLPGFQAPSASVMSDLPSQSNTIIYTQAMVGTKTRLGENVYISSGTNISHHCVVEDHVFIASGVLTGGNCHIERNAVIGLGAILRSGVRIGQGAFVGMGAVVTLDVEPHTVVVGHPARRISLTPQEAAAS